MLATEERCQEIRILAETYSRLATLVEKRDRAGLIQEFETAQTFFTEEKKTHLKALPTIFNQRHKKDLEPQINLQQL